MRISARNVTVLVVFIYLVIALVPPAMTTACEGCEPGPRALAAQTGGADGGDEEGGINPGVFVLVIVVASIIVATIMVLRQSKPGLPEDFDDLPEDGTSGEQDTSAR